MRHGVVVVLSLACLAAKPGEVRFAEGERAGCIPFDSANRHIGLQARVNGLDGLRLVLDTGAGGSVLDASRADALGLEPIGEQRAVGSGGVETGSIVGGVQVSLPGIDFVDQTMGTLSLGVISGHSGRPIDGILGYPVLSRLVVEVDYPKGCVTLIDPESYRYDGPGRTLRITFQHNLPYVEARLVLPDGRSISGKFLIDTGASTGLILSPRAVEREGIRASLGKTIAVASRGVGGATDLDLARVASLELGGFSLVQPIAALKPPGPGRISADGTLGNIGAGILTRFKVVFDYPRKRMILEPGPELRAPFETDMSGLTLVSEPPDFRRVTVMRVRDGSPASDAGIRVADEIETVDGTPVGEIGLSALRERLRRDGQDLDLGLLRGEESLTVRLRTRRII